VLRLLGGAPRVSDEGAVFDPQVQVLATLYDRLRVPRPWEMTPAEARARFLRSSRLLGAAPPPVAHVEDRWLPGSSGPLRARLYRPVSASRSEPAMLFMHGGGFVMGSIDTHDAFCRRLCRDAGCGVLSLDYRLAPEHRWPAAPEDAFAAWSWLQAHAAELGFDADRLAIGGDSAGGCLTVLTTVAARDAGRPPAAHALLIYPGLDFMRSKPSRALFDDGFFLDRELGDWFQELYLPDRALASDPRASPWFVEDLAGLPRTTVVVAGFDPLRDENRSWADRLTATGVEARLHEEPTLPHGFINMDGAVDAADRANARICALVREALKA
jgi:acetyl esterase